MYNHSLKSWNTFNVEDMTSMFENNKAFNQNIKHWNVTKCEASGKHQYFALNGVLIDEYNPFVKNNKFKPKTKEELKTYCKNNSNSLADVDTSLITNMSYLFYYSTRTDFTGIEDWDVSNVTDMTQMFYNCETIDHSLNKWNVSKVIYMTSMFAYTTIFNQPLDKWDVSNVTNVSYMFELASSFNQDLSNWDVSNVTNYLGFARSCPINNTYKMPKFKN